MRSARRKRGWCCWSAWTDSSKLETAPWLIAVFAQPLRILADCCTIAHLLRDRIGSGSQLAVGYERCTMDWSRLTPRVLMGSLNKTSGAHRMRNRLFFGGRTSGRDARSDISCAKN